MKWIYSLSIHLLIIFVLHVSFQLIKLFSKNPLEIISCCNLTGDTDTLQAAVRFLSIMSSWMSLQPHWFSERLPTLGAAEGFSPVWILKCISNVSSRANDIAHSEQLWGFLPPVWISNGLATYTIYQKTVCKCNYWIFSQQCALSNGTGRYFFGKTILRT